MDIPQVEELIEYTRELEGQIFEKNINDTYNKDHMFKTMLQDIMTSCREYEENKILKERYPELYEEINADTLVKNLLDYITNMNIKNDLKL
jgi:hypothetical protein